MINFLKGVGIYAWCLFIGCAVPVMLIVGAVKLFVWFQAAQ